MFGQSQALEHLGLALDALAMGGVDRDLEDELLRALALSHDQRVRRAAPAEAADDDEPPLEYVAGLGHARVHGRLARLDPPLLLGVRQVYEELVHGFDAAADIGVGARADQLLEVTAGTVEGVGKAQPVARPQLLGQLERRGGGRLAGEQVVGDGAEREHVVVRCRHGRALERLGREVDLGRVGDVVVEVPRAGGALRRGGARVAAAAGLPVHDLDPRARRIQIAHEHALRGERPVVEALAVGVAKCLGQLAEEVEP